MIFFHLTGLCSPAGRSGRLPRASLLPSPAAAAAAAAAAASSFAFFAAFFAFLSSLPCEEALAPAPAAAAAPLAVAGSALACFAALLACFAAVRSAPAPAVSAASSGSFRFFSPASAGAAAAGAAAGAGTGAAAVGHALHTAAVVSAALLLSSISVHSFSAMPSRSACSGRRRAAVSASASDTAAITAWLAHLEVERILCKVDELCLLARQVLVREQPLRVGL